MAHNIRHRSIGAGWKSIVGFTKNAAEQLSALCLRKGSAEYAPLSDHILRDIGLARGNVERTLYRLRSGSGL